MRVGGLPVGVLDRSTSTADRRRPVGGPPAARADGDYRCCR